ncbi:hypothetical protein Efla_000409 [Eimeria flavescens]
MAAFECYSSSEEGAAPQLRAKGAPPLPGSAAAAAAAAALASPFAGLSPNKQEALMQLLEDLKDELHEAAEGRMGAWDPTQQLNFQMLSEAHEAPNMQTDKTGFSVSSAWSRCCSVSSSFGGRAVTLLSLESSLEEAATHEDAASLFASSAILRTSLWDSSSSSNSCSSSSSSSNGNSSCNTPTEGSSLPVLPQTAAAALAAPAAAAAAALAAAAAAAEQCDSLCIPDEAVQIPWPLAFPKRQPRWGPARGRFSSVDP